METKCIHVIPHLSFSGNCEEAIHTYIDAFGGEIFWLSRWSEETFDVTPAQAGKVMHAEFTLGQTRMAASDAFGDDGQSTRIKLMIHMDSMEDARRAIHLLAQGGEKLSPLKPHPKPDDGGCGSVTRDRFGYTWIITCPNPEKNVRQSKG
ncbi:MAG: VOC family protein [Clostridiales bacterium]|nr:VOC family protein [Clostridiales bacterium]